AGVVALSDDGGRGDERVAERGGCVEQHLADAALSDHGQLQRPVQGGRVGGDGGVQAEAADAEQDARRVGDGGGRGEVDVLHGVARGNARGPGDRRVVAAGARVGADTGGGGGEAVHERRADDPGRDQGGRC